MTGTDHHIAGLGNLIEWTNVSGQNGPKGGKMDTAPQRGMPGCVFTDDKASHAAVHLVSEIV